MRKAAFHNLGCKVNSYETEAMQELLEEAGYEIVPFGEGADVYIVNTCSVTNVADKKSRQMLHRARKLNPGAVVAAVGCYAQAAGEELKGDGAVDLVIGNNRKRAPDQPRFGSHQGVYEGAGWVQPVLQLLHHPLYPRPGQEQEPAGGDPGGGRAGGRRL